MAGSVEPDCRGSVAARLKPLEIDQVPALAATTIGFPAAVAAFTWIRDCLDRPD